MSPRLQTSSFLHRSAFEDTEADLQLTLDQFERQMAAVEREMHSLKLKDDTLVREIAHAQDDIQRLKQQLGACERDKQVCWVRGAG